MRPVKLYSKEEGGRRGGRRGRVGWKREREDEEDGGGREQGERGRVGWNGRERMERKRRTR